MARAIWTGAISFGLVTVPVGLFSATEQRDVRFRQLQRGTGSRIRYRRVAEASGEEVEYGDIVKGYELEDGGYVVLTPEELEAVEPGRTRMIDVHDFVDLSDIDPVYYEKTYYLAPRDETARRPYALLRQAMLDAGRIAIGTFVMRTKQYLAAIRPQEDLLVLETMFFPDEVRNPVRELDELPVDVKLVERELGMARQLVETLSTTWQPQSYHDTYRERVLALIEQKRQGRDVVAVPRPEPSADVVDLMAALRASVDAAKGLSRPAEPGAGDVAEMSLGALRLRAKELGVAGRSKMKRSELQRAVSEAEQRRVS
jgi:DNA end-binding protein Ku